MKRERKVFNLKVTEAEMFAITEAVNEKLEEDRNGKGNDYLLPLLANERNALHGVIRKAEAAISEHHGSRR